MSREGCYWSMTLGFLRCKGRFILPAFPRQIRFFEKKKAPPAPPPQRNPKSDDRLYQHSKREIYECCAPSTCRRGVRRGEAGK